MIKVDAQPVGSEGRWQTVAEFSLPGEAGCVHQAASLVAETLAGVRVPESVLREAKRAVTSTMEKELSRPVDDQACRSFTILIRAQAAPPTEMLANPSGRWEGSPRQKGWGFFLTGKTTTHAELGHEMHHVVMSLHLYQEGNPV
jgi:hypothetical protein